MRNKITAQQAINTNIHALRMRNTIIAQRAINTNIHALRMLDVDVKMITSKSIFVPEYNKTIKAKSYNELWHKLFRFLKKVKRDKGHVKINIQENRDVYVTKRYIEVMDKIKDLLCISHIDVLLVIHPNKNNGFGKCVSGRGPVEVHVGIKGGGLSASTLIHELLHAAGYDHKRNINGYSDFMSNGRNDLYSKLICSDLFGKKEVII